MIEFQPERVSNCGTSTGEASLAACPPGSRLRLESYEFLPAKQLAMFPAAHHTASLHMSGKVNYASTKSGGTDRLITFAFRARKTFQINTGSEHKEPEYSRS
jgi:hypothetical protein